MSARSTRRTGFSDNRGSLNPKITNSDTFPKNPKLNDIFFDNVNYIQFYYDGSIWLPMSGNASSWEAGENLNRGESLYFNQSDGKLWKTPTSGDMAVGVCIYDVTATNTAIYGHSGIFYVLPETGLSLSKGYVISSSTTQAGRVQNAAAVPSSTQHFREQGHVCEDSSAAGALTRCTLHFN